MLSIIVLGTTICYASWNPPSISYSWVDRNPAAKRLQESIDRIGAQGTLSAYKKAAENGDSEAQFYMASWHMEGVALKQDDTLALNWLIKSVDQDYLFAQLLLGMAYFEGELGLTADAEAAYRWLSKGAARGDAIAEFALAGLYLDGTHEYVNAERGGDLLERSATKGYADAQTRLAFCFANGTGMEANMEKAAYWMEEAAGQGQPYAQFELGLFYYHGRLEQGKNIEKAVEWIKKAAEQEHPEAEYSLAGLCARGEGVAASPELALKWGLRAADHGHVLAQVEMARNYSGGRGVKKDKKEAVKWFSRAAENGDVESQEFLMYVFAFGDGVETNQQEATRWALRAAMNGSVNAQVRMVHAYGKGLGVVIDPGESYAWAIITDHNNEPKWKEIVEPLFSVDDKVRGHRRARELEKQIRALKARRADSFPRKP